MGATGFTNSWTSGEIDENAWDRVELQPVAKACQLAQNLIPRIAGPLGKRRGLWLNGSVNNPAQQARLMPFRRSITDAVVIEFGPNMAYVWQTNGAPLLSGGVQVSFATPFADAELAKLRYKQVGDVIYFRSADGMTPQALVRTSNTSWAFNTTDFINGPWLAENITLTDTITVTGASTNDVNTSTGAGVMFETASVDLVANTDLFVAGMVGSNFRIRQSTGSPGITSWSPQSKFTTGQFLLYNGLAYLITSGSGEVTSGNTPPIHTSGTVSDGGINLEYLHDGAGVVQITAVSSPTAATGVVLRPVPLASGTATSYYSQAAYSALNGWPTAWPEIREERLADGATSANLDFADLTQTAGFAPTQEDFTPGTGTDIVIDTNGIRRRMGTDGGQILGFYTCTYLVALTTTGEHIVAGSVLDEPLSPAGVTVKQLSSYGSADVKAQPAHKGLLFVDRTGQTLRELVIDTQQVANDPEDLSYLAQHLATRGFAQLAWVPTNDNNLWIRLADGGFCVFTYHQQQGVKGFTTQLAGGGFTIEDMIVMPGPGNLETLWCVASQVVNGATNRVIMMQSQPSDGLFMDAAQSYSGAAVGTIGGFELFNGQALDVVADGAWYPGLVPVDGEITLPDGATASAIQAGFTYPIEFISGKLDLRIFNGALLTKQRIAQAIVDVKTAGCSIGADSGFAEEIPVRWASDVPGALSRRVNREVTIAATEDSETGSRDPRIWINEQTPYDFVLYAIKASEVDFAS